MIRTSIRRRVKPREGFAEGEAHQEEFPEDEEVGRFSEGQDEEPPGYTS